MNSTLLTPMSTGQQRIFEPTTSFTVNIPAGEMEGDSEEEEAMQPALEGVGTGSGPEAALTNLLLQLLPGTLTRTYNTVLPRAGMDQFLQPVIIRPTAEQIAANTSVGMLVSDTDNSCAICQDTLTAEQEGRKLNHCGHWFHRGCIDTWLQGNVHCPVCRHDIREPAVESARTG
jgi:hypothetical protein